MAEKTAPRVVPGIYEILTPSNGVPDPTAALSSIQRTALAMGMESPWKRSLFVASLVSAGVWLVQPGVSFYSGSARGFEDGGVPWWIWPAAGVVLVNLLT